MMFDCIKIIFNDFHTYLSTVKEDYEDDRKYYYFSKNIDCSDLNDNRVKFVVRAGIHYVYDSYILETDEHHDQIWICLNEKKNGITVFPPGKRINTFKSCVIDSSYITFRYNYKNDEVHRIPCTTDEYFNLSILQELPFTLGQFIEIKEFLTTNSEIIKNYGIMMEVS